MAFPDSEPLEAPGRPDAQGRTTGVLLSHGFTGSPASMNPWGRHLAEHGYAVSVPLLPGHARTWQEMNHTGYDDWYAEVERAFEALRARTDRVVVGGLSMGGGLVLRLASRHPRDVAGVMLVNAAVSSQNKQLRAVPALKWVLGSMPGVGSDIKKPGVVEAAYDRVPLKALHSMLRGWKQVRAELPAVTQPVLIWRSREDHVVDPGSTRDIVGSVSSRDLTEHVLENSYHVATMDNDADLIFAESVDFVARVTGGEGG